MNAHEKYDDESLIIKFYQTQDNRWLGILLQRYTLLLLGVCMKYLQNEEEAKDAVQQVFYKALNEMPKHQIKTFRAWIYTIAKNYCLMQLRSGKNLILEEWKENVQETLSEELPQNFADRERLFGFMEEALKLLNEEQRMCISLFYLNKKTYSEIAAITGFSDTQVKSHIQNGKRNMKISIVKMQRKNDR